MTQPSGSIELRPNRAGQQRAYIINTRVRVQDIYALSEVQGKSADEIVLALPQLSLAQVHAALAYYFDHRDEILREVREDECRTAAIRGQLGEGPLESRLRSTE